MSVPRFLVGTQAIASGSAVLRGSELHHLRVRRVRCGDTVVLLDGNGHQRRGIVASLDRRQALIQLIDEVVPPAESALRLVLAQAVLKPAKLDMVIEKATELGVSDLVVFTCERSMPATQDRAVRWNRIATSAAKQCQRASVPRIRGPIRFDTLLQEEHAALRLLFWEGATGGTVSTLAPQHRSYNSLLAVVGPEGGFSELEAAHAVAMGCLPVTLGRRILRAETAAIVAVSLCQMLWGDLGDHPSS